MFCIHSMGVIATLQIINGQFCLHKSVSSYTLATEKNVEQITQFNTITCTHNYARRTQNELN